jgi:hypothetical protein
MLGVSVNVGHLDFPHSLTKCALDIKDLRV